MSSGDLFSRAAVGPVSLDDISSIEEEQDFATTRASTLDETRVRVDYSDFDNFVWFNSALDYFNVSAERILNRYPFDGTRADLEAFDRESDGYERHLLQNTWPRRVGHLRFMTATSSSYVRVDDRGYDGGLARTSLLSPGSGSFSVEAWLRPEGTITGSDRAQVVVQKLDDNGSGFSLYLSGALAFFQVVSGSSTGEVSASIGSSAVTFLSAVCDRSTFTGTLLLYTGSATTFPVVAMSASLPFYTALDVGSASLYIGSGTLSGKTIELFTGSLDDVRVWRVARTAVALSSSYGAKTYAQRGLVGLWRFNESGSAVNDDENTVVLDHSGHGLVGRIQNYFTGLRGSGSLMATEEPDPIVSINAAEVRSFISEQQTSGSAHDRDNETLITRLFPEDFTREDEAGNSVGRDFLFILARNFDQIRAAAGQIAKATTVGYGSTDDTPDALLEHVARLYGWDFVGSFLSADSIQYLTGRRVLANVDGNNELPEYLSKIQNELWRRTLANLVYVYKTKGTPHSVGALLRSYGLNENYVRLKEFSSLRELGFQGSRVSAQKSVHALCFGSGSVTASLGFKAAASTPAIPTVEIYVQFPTTASDDLQPTFLTGSIWHFGISGTSDDFMTRLQYRRVALDTPTGSIVFQSDTTFMNSWTDRVSVTNQPLFDGRWWMITLRRVSGSFKIDALNLDQYGDVTRRTGSGEWTHGSIPMISAGPKNFTLGGHPEFSQEFNPSVALSGSAEFWARDLRLWSRALDDDELVDHARNFQSYGTRDVATGSLVVHARLDTYASASSVTTLQTFEDVSMNGYHLTGSGFKPSVYPFKKFLLDYQYQTPPDLGWNEDKIEIVDSHARQRSRAIDDDPVVALEFNIVDALNEDMSQIMATLEQLETAIARPASETDYNGLRVLRERYFRRLQDRLNFRIFADMLDFFDRSFVDMVRRLVPARAYFIGDEQVVESHMFERSKVSYGHVMGRRQEKHQTLEGVVGLRDRRLPRFLGR